MLGTVLSVQANYYWVRLDEVPDSVSVSNDGFTASVVPKSGFATTLPLLLCTRRSRLKKMGQQVWVGDRVRVEEPDWDGQRGAITEVLERQSELDRPPVANADHLLLVFAMADPVLDPIQLSRFLIKAESTQLGITLCLNKAELVSTACQKEWRDRLAQWGYDPCIISLHQRTGLDRLHRGLKNYRSIISGPSGVGKSSLINALIPDVEQRVNAVSGKLGRGRHTTRHVELFQLPWGGLVADTPGFNQPDLDCVPPQLGQYFPEIRQRLSHNRCQFNNCLHRDEPNCVVRGDWERYEHYLLFLDDAMEYETQQEQRRGRDIGTKVKSGQRGQCRIEPKLEPKRYRRKSRRSEIQHLQEWCGDVKDMMPAEPSE